MQERHYPESNPKLERVIESIRKKRERLRSLVSESAKIRLPAKAKVVRPPKPIQIANAVDRLPLDVQQMKLFKFDQLEAVKR